MTGPVPFEPLNPSRRDAAFTRWTSPIRQGTQWPFPSGDLGQLGRAQNEGPGGPGATPELPVVYNGPNRWGDTAPPPPRPTRGPLRLPPSLLLPGGPSGSPLSPAAADLSAYASYPPGASPKTSTATPELPVVYNGPNRWGDTAPQPPPSLQQFMQARVGLLPPAYADTDLEAAYGKIQADDR